MIQIVNYITISGKEPIEDWLQDLDTNTRSIIRTRIARVRLGNFGDCKPIKGGNKLWELIIDYGPGYRIYFGKEGLALIILLIGGIKRSQNRDIEKAKRYWQEYKEKHEKKI